MVSADGLASLEGLFTREDRQLLAEIGFMAIGGGFPAAAALIFEAVEIVSPAGAPNLEAARIGRALAALGLGCPDDAVAILRAAPPSDAVAVYLGMALARAGAREEAEEVLSDLLATGPDEAHAELARATLAEIRGA